MNDTTLTIVGNLVDEPRLRKTANGHPVANFRVASTSRRFDREKGVFVDNSTLFVTVSAWRQLGLNVAASLHKGNAVVVTGRFTLREWTADEQPRSAYDLEAIAVGHDLSRGTTEFTRVYGKSQTVSVERDDDGVPSDQSDHYLGLLAPVEDLPADPFTLGEEREPELATT